MKFVQIQYDDRYWFKRSWFHFYLLYVNSAVLSLARQKSRRQVLRLQSFKKMVRPCCIIFRMRWLMMSQMFLLSYYYHECSDR